MPSKAKIIGHQWRFDTLWNEALRSIPQRPMVKREHIWASELGGSFCDRYLKMHAHPMSNPPNDRSLRKFSAGHIWEWILGVVLTSTGILKGRQLHGEVQLPGLLKVTGKLDFIAGGAVDWEKARAEAAIWKDLFASSISQMPPIITHSIDLIINRMEKEFSKNPLEEVILEGKSIGSFMFEKLTKTQRAMDHHVLQNLHYVIPNKLPGTLLYISKDDCLSEQFRVEPSRGLLQLYKNDVATMTEIYRASGRNYMKNIPKPMDEIEFDQEMFRFSRCFRVEYSSYLTMLYNLKSPEAYRMKWQRQLTSWNRVIKRAALGEQMTDSNKKYLKEMLKMKPDLDKYIQRAKKTGFFKTEEYE